MEDDGRDGWNWSKDVQIARSHLSSEHIEYAKNLFTRNLVIWEPFGENRTIWGLKYVRKDENTFELVRILDIPNAYENREYCDNLIRSAGLYVIESPEIEIIPENKAWAAISQDLQAKNDLLEASNKTLINNYKKQNVLLKRLTKNCETLEMKHEVLNNHFLHFYETVYKVDMATVSRALGGSGNQTQANVVWTQGTGPAIQWNRKI